MERNRRINVTLEPSYAQKLASLAERTHVQEGTLARSLLAWERAQVSIEQARRGDTVPLSEL
jgi:hypothetical protein